LNTASYQGLNAGLRTIRNHAGANLTAPLQDAEHSSFAACVTAFLLHAGLAILVHVPRLAANPCFINFDFTTEIAAGQIILHRKSCSVKHKPSRLLGHADGAVKFPGANAVSVASNHPCRRKPLVKPKWGVLKNSPELHAELRLRMPRPTLKHASGGDKAD